MVPPLSWQKRGPPKARRVFSFVSLFAAEHIIERQSRFQEGGLAMTKDQGSDGRNNAGHTSGGHDAGEDAALQARLSRLSSALDQHQNPAAPDGMKVPEFSGQELSASNLGFRVLVEFFSAILVGSAHRLANRQMGPYGSDLSLHLPALRDGGGAGEYLSDLGRPKAAARRVKSG